MEDDLAHEARWLRELLQRVANDLAQLTQAERDPTRRDLLQRRSLRIRQRLYEGPSPTSRSTIGVGRV